MDFVEEHTLFHAPSTLPHATCTLQTHPGKMSWLKHPKLSGISIYSSGILIHASIVSISASLHSSSTKENILMLPAENQPSFFRKFRQDHPYIVTAAKVTAGTGIAYAGTSVLTASLLVVALKGIGFTPGGVAGGSYAAAIQSARYGGATKGRFSACQSVGATAVASGRAIMTSAIIIYIGAVAAGVSIIGFKKNKPDGKPNQPSGSER